MTSILTLLAVVGVVFGFFGLVGVGADYVLPALCRIFPALGRKMDEFYHSLPMSRDDWDK